MARTLFVAVALIGAWLALTVSPVSADMNCDDFGSHAEAQTYFERNGGSSTNNVDGLDRDGDGLACELGPDSGYTGSTSSRYDDYDPPYDPRDQYDPNPDRDIDGHSKSLLRRQWIASIVIVVGCAVVGVISGLNDKHKKKERLRKLYGDNPPKWMK